MSSFSPTDLLSLYSLIGERCFGTASLIPPSSVQSSTNSHSHRYNIIAGSSFAVSCSVGIPGHYFNIDFYIDNLTSPITDGTLPNTTISKTSTKTIPSLLPQFFMLLRHSTTSKQLTTDDTSARPTFLG